MSTSIAGKIADASTEVRNRQPNSKTVPTLFWQINSDSVANSMFNWASANLPSSTLQPARKATATLAILTTRLEGRTHLLAVLPDGEKATVKQFLDSIPQRPRRTLRTVCTDRWDGYVNAVRESLQTDPECQVELVVDRFHVTEHYYEAADTLRKKEMKRLKQELPAEEYQQFHGAMWLFRRRSTDLPPDDRTRLEHLFSHAPALHVVYTLREKLSALFDAPWSKEEAAWQITAWSAKVQASGLDCFNKFLTTLTNWRDEILNYFHQRFCGGLQQQS